MNATEHIVETYFRHKGHFTISDVKVIKGNNRQFDLLTFDNVNKKFYHIEVSVTHAQNWTHPLSNISELVKQKFFGVPKNNRPDNPNTDYAKNKSYHDSIKDTYLKFGINFEDVIRVWCTWSLTKDELNGLNDWKQDLANQFELTADKFEILLFRDQVLEYLISSVGTSNYDDELLRTFSLLGEYRRQTKK